MRYLAIDYGTKRTGLAICDPTEAICSPLTVIHGRKELLARVVDIIETEQVEAVVLGLPLNMDGTEGPQSRLVHEFAGKLKKTISIPVYFQDERLSSFGAEEKLAVADFTRAGKKKRIDAVAAAEILEAFLEQRRSTGNAGINPAS